MPRIFQGSTAILVAILLRTLIFFGMLKFLASVTDQAEFGVLTQVMAIGASFSSLAAGGISQGVIRQVAAETDSEQQNRWMNVASMIALASGAFLSLVCMALFEFAPAEFVGGLHNRWIFLVIAVAQAFTGYGLLAQSYFSGLGKIGFVAISWVGGSLIALVTIFIATVYFGADGRLFACAIIGLGPGVLAISMLFFSQPRRTMKIFGPRWDVEQTKILFFYGSAFVVSAVALPTAFMFMRSYIGASEGWAAVARWQAVARVGDAYTQFYGAWFSSILIPMMVSRSPNESLLLVKKYMPPMMALFCCGGVFFWFFGPQLLTIAFSKAYSNASDFIPAQVTGDFLKICSNFLVYRFLAHGRPIVQLSVELLQAAVMVIIFVALYSSGAGAISAVSAFAISSFVALACVTVFTFRDFRRKVVL
jgi:enterobacterial common antigen flippase